MKKVLLLISPKSRRGADSITAAHDQLQALGYSIINDPNQESIDPNVLIEKHANEISFVIVGGGDGSVNMVLPALVKTQVPLVVIPLGTANNLARHYELSYDISEALNVISSGTARKIDLGMVNGIYFVNVVGMGLSTYVNRSVPSKLKRFLGPLAFVLTAFWLSTKIRPFRLHITADGKEYIRRSWQISVCNGRHYGNGLVVKHDASLTDGKLHALSTEVEKWWQGFFLIPALISGRYKIEQDISLFALRPDFLMWGHDHQSSIKHFDEAKKTLPIMLASGTTVSSRVREEANSFNWITVTGQDVHIKTLAHEKDVGFVSIKDFHGALNKSSNLS